ncbi:MAG: hypothetical protein WBP10_02320 [Thermoanaerobaculia bacterium]|jgi:hypothetical protein
MASMLDRLMGSLQSSGGIGEMTRSLGMDESDVTKVISGALPVLMAEDAGGKVDDVAGGAWDAVAGAAKDGIKNGVDDIDKV